MNNTFITMILHMQLFVSKEFARYQGYASMQDAVIGLRTQTKQG